MHITEIVSPIISEMNWVYRPILMVLKPSLVPVATIDGISCEIS